MGRWLKPVSVLGMLGVGLGAFAQTSITLDFTKPGHKVSPMLYGLMTEEINHSYDGGLYAELIQNRAFKDSAPGPNANRSIPHWTAIGDAQISLDSANPVSKALGTSLKIVGGNGAGVSNDGYWGMPIRPSTTYRASLFVRSSDTKSLEVTLESPDGRTVYAQATLNPPSDSTGKKWTQIQFMLKTRSSAPVTSDARLVIRTSGGTTWLSLVSLFPPTTNNRPNGTRPDLLGILKAMKPSFLRFPGGNYLEGNTFKDRFDWKKTLGPLSERPGHMAPWGYRSSDGLGFLEYMNWIEDMNAKPVLGIFAGYVLRGDVIEAGTELQGFVDDALNQIEYLVGDVKTKWGARRALDGHPAPFPLEYVEIGNEDGFDLSGSYEGRFVQFYDAIKRKYPKIKIISSTGGKDWLGQRFPIRQRKPDLVDEHYYSSTWEMMAMATKYDSYDRKGPKIFVGEWAAQDVPEPWTNPGQKGPTPNLNCALADAAFMTGMERNADLIEMSCYAPLLVNVNPGARQWAVNLIGYDALSCFGSPSYHAQQMFMANLGDRTVVSRDADVPTQTNGKDTIPSLFHVATRDTKTGMVYLKVVNASAKSASVTVKLDGVKSIDSTGTMLRLSGTDLKAMNSITEPANVVPVNTVVTGYGPSFRMDFPGYSVSVLRIQTK